MLNYPDEFSSPNADIALLDGDRVRGGRRVVADRATLYALVAKADQLKQNATVVYVEVDAENGGNPSTLLLTDSANIDNADGWKAESTGGDSITGFTRTGSTLKIVTSTGTKTLDLSEKTYASRTNWINEPSFDNQGTWQQLGGWVIGNGSAVANNGSYLYQLFNVAQPVTLDYEITIASITSGSVIFNSTADNAGHEITTPGTYKYSFPSPAGQNFVQFFGQNNFVGEITDCYVYTNGLILQDSYDAPFVHKAGVETIPGRKTFSHLDGIIGTKFIGELDGSQLPNVPVSYNTFSKLAIAFGAVMAGANGAIDTFIEAFNRFVQDENAASALNATVQLLKDNIGSLPNLNTAQKSNLVAAINELASNFALKQPALVSIIQTDSYGYPVYSVPPDYLNKALQLACLEETTVILPTLTADNVPATFWLWNSPNNNFNIFVRGQFANSSSGQEALILVLAPGEFAEFKSATLKRYYPYTTDTPVYVKASKSGEAYLSAPKQANNTRLIKDKLFFKQNASALLFDMTQSGNYPAGAFIGLDTEDEIPVFYYQDNSTGRLGLVELYPDGIRMKGQLVLNASVSITNSAEPPTNPNGGVLWVENGELWYKGSAGTPIKLGNA